MFDIVTVCGGQSLGWCGEHPKGGVQEKAQALAEHAVSEMSPVGERGAWFREARFGMFIHWGIYSIPGKGEWSYAYDKYAPGEYEGYAKKFNPVNYNPREWAKLARAAGMKYAVLTSRHHDGFCMFDSHFTDYKITKTPYGPDAVKEFLEAFRTEGLKVGLYHSLPDWTHPGYADTESPECMREGGGEVPHVPTAEQYNAFTNLVYNHINQLTTEYGKLDLLFLDYTSKTKANLDYFGRDRILEMVYRNQPDILVNDRLSYYKDNCRDFDYYTPEICVPNQPQQVKGRDVMWETCATMNDHWGHCREDENWKSTEAIVAGLIGCVSRNGNLLLNVGPNELGEIPAGSVKVLRSLADWYKINGESVTGCGKSEHRPPHGCVYTQKGNSLYCHFLQTPLGDTILPELKGKISTATLLRTGEKPKLVNHWGFELLKPDEQRLRARGIRPGDVVRLELNDVVVEGEADVRISDDVVTVTSTGAVSFARIAWPQAMPCETLVLNDAWERSYGDLEWKDLTEKRVSPWYYLASVSNRTWGVGVETGPGAMCCWEVTTNGTTLVLDLRAGGQPVRLGGRTLRACRIVRAESREGESAWEFGCRFCKMMCPKPKLPKAPVYGYNDWYCAYGKNTATNFLADAAYIMECAKGCANPPYVVMDDGWQRNSPPVVHESGRGPWDAAGPNFGMDMPTFCGRIAALGAKPGLWYRPLRAWDELPDEQRLLANRDYLDPTVPAVKSRIVEDMCRFRDWGVKLVKIDFLSFDLAQFWPCDPHPHYDRYIQDDRAWRDSSRTTAEVMRDLYQAMKDAVGDDVVIISCNAFNHLAAGVFELQRTGCDTSGKKWSWTRDHGVNTLGMRSIQDGAFFKIDADCVGLAEKGAVPWELNRQWMDLLGRSGTPFFVSWRRQLAGSEVRKALAEAFRRASSERPVIEPVDWQGMRTPSQWRDVDETGSYNWWKFEMR